MISFSHAYKYAAISSGERSDHSTEHLSLTCHPNSISSSLFPPHPATQASPFREYHDLHWNVHVLEVSVL